jgi:hypothetical protein
VVGIGLPLFRRPGAGRIPIWIVCSYVGIFDPEHEVNLHHIEEPVGGQGADALGVPHLVCASGTRRNARSRRKMTRSGYCAPARGIRH